MAYSELCEVGLFLKRKKEIVKSVHLLHKRMKPKGIFIQNMIAAGKLAWRA